MPLNNRAATDHVRTVLSDAGIHPRRVSILSRDTVATTGRHAYTVRTEIRAAGADALLTNLFSERLADLTRQLPGHVETRADNVAVVVYWAGPS